MARTIYALLVGIDNYPAGVNSLHGCVNDIKRVQTLLEKRIVGEGDTFAPLVLTDAAAVRQAVTDGFQQHLGQAKKDDVALFYYSGHGSQAPSPPEFWPLEPDHLDETIVCWDSRQPGKWDLADKELAKLIAGVAEGGAHIVVILDCCHSGSGTREVGEPDVRVRRVPTDTRLRPLETFLVSAAEAAANSPANRGVDGSGWYSLAHGRHVVLAACSPEELAKELTLGGEQRGAFSYYLLDTLQSAQRGVTYRDAFKRVNSLVRARVALQSPQMEATNPADLDQPILGGAIASGQPYFTIGRNAKQEWVMDGGAVHGIPQPDGQETTWLAIFPFDTEKGDLLNLEKKIGDGQVQSVGPAQSVLALTFADGSTPDPNTTYKAIVTALPLTPLNVALEGDTAALALVRDALGNAAPDNKPSLLVREGTAEMATLLLTAEADTYSMRRKGDAYGLVVDTAGFTTQGAKLAVQRLEHIARWFKVVELANPTTQLRAASVHMEIMVLDRKTQTWQPAASGTTVQLTYEVVDGNWQAPQFKVKLTNMTNQRLYCMLLDLPETYGIGPVLPGGGVWLNPNEEVWAAGGEALIAEIPEALWRQGIVQFKDILKMIATTDECDATLLQQDDLPVKPSSPSLRGILSARNTLDRLMARVQTRTFTLASQKKEVVADWIVDEVSCTTIRPLAATEIPAAGEADLAVEDGTKVVIQGHPTLKAQARLSNLPAASRDAGNLTLPALLRDHPDVIEPFEFSTSRGGEPGLSVLELSNVVDYTVVTPHAPLVVTIQRPLVDGTYLLPFGFDGEFYLPLGRVQRKEDAVVVTLERLPAPTTNGERSLGGSVRILFQKVAGQALGAPYDYPQLAVASVDDQGQVSYVHDQAIVKQKVAGAQNILLYVHGITGDTRGMAASAFPAWLKLPSHPAGLGERYDLILTFDYESVNTPIEENARSLSQRLSAVGLGAEEGKRLHIVAHSMGGLVARWFIEREGGNQVVERLLMMGTPNAGSPWPTVEDWATASLALGLNGLSAVAWPTGVLASLIGALEAADVGLDQMGPDSQTLKLLSESSDPGVAYTIVAGNTTLAAAAFEAAAAGQESRLARLWPKIAPKRWLYAVTAPVFFNQPNDLAVSIASMQSVPKGRSHLEIIAPIACDHLTYFASDAGLQALADSLAAQPAGGQ